MSNREPITIIELEMDYCANTFGVSPCTAALGVGVDYKCFNTFPTCVDKENFVKTTLTYRFVQPRSNYPKGATTFPCLISTSTKSAQANIAGSDDSLYALGVRGKITASFHDFTYHDRFCDKYQSERISGAAQLDGIGYNPAITGSFWQKFKARNPNYTGRPMRELTGYLDGGVLTIETTRHFIIDEFQGPDSNGAVSIIGKDVLKLADDDRAVAPAQSNGKISDAMDSTSLTSITLIPESIGDEYDTSGFAAIGSELVSFTRVGDVVTITERGLNGTSASTHSVDAAFQQTFSPRGQRIDSVIYDLLILAGVDDSFIPVADWSSECDRWATTLNLTADIMKPTGVAKLIGELAVLGITIWWDDVDQEIKLLVNRPVDTDTIKDISDTNNAMSTAQEDRDSDRLTEIIFRTVQINPSNGVSENNFSEGDAIYDLDAKYVYSYGDSRIKEIFCRWLNLGDASTVRILSKRLLNRFTDAPVRYEVSVDIDDDVQIAEVVRLETESIPSPTGKIQTALAQVIKREDIIQGHSLKMTLQNFQFDKRYGYFTENDRSVYTSSTQAQKDRGAYWCDATEIFSDGGDAYRFP